MRTTERMHMIAVMMKGLESSVTTYCKAKEKKGYTQWGGCKESIKRRITIIREELLNISKEL